MDKRWLVPVAAALFVTLPALAQKPAPKAATKPGPSWEAMRAEIEKSWAQSYPREKILNLEKKGELDFKEEYGGSETSTFGSASFSWTDWSTTWTETTTTREKPRGRFCRQVVLVTVERPNGSRARFTVAAVYKQNGPKWDYAEVAVRPEIEELGGGGDVPAPPPAAEALKMFLAQAQKQCLPEYKIATAKIEGEPKLGRSGKRFWYTYKVILDGQTPAGKKVQCEVTDLAWLRWDAEKKSWSVDSSFGCSSRACSVEE